MTAKAALCKALLDGRKLNVKNCFTEIGLTNIAREIPRMIERPFGVDCTREFQHGKSRYGQSVTWVDYTLCQTLQSKEGIEKMKEYIKKSTMMKHIIAFAFALIICFSAKSQCCCCCKSYRIAEPVSEYTYLYDSVNFVFRPYKSLREALIRIPLTGRKYMGKPLAFYINSSGTLMENGMFYGGSVDEYVFDERAIGGVRLNRKDFLKHK